MTMDFFYFHLMPWPHLPRDFDRRHDSAWVTLPNRAYDPVRGHRLYNEYLDELETAERLGFDGVCVNEHHQSAYGTMPSPNLMAAALVRRTSRVRIAVLGNAIGLRDHPLRVAEEIAMLDVMSGGRIISGFVRGIGCEHFSLGVNPTYSRERFYEAHDLILRAWTEPGPFSFEVDAPAAVEVTLFHQPDKRRFIVNLVNEQEEAPPIPVSRARGQPPNTTRCLASRRGEFPWRRPAGTARRCPIGGRAFLATS